MGGPSSPHADALDYYKGVLAVTLSYFVLWYIFLFRQSYVNRRIKSKFQKDDKTFNRWYSTYPPMLNADRTVANTIEQGIPFLVSLWLYAIFVDATYATILGFAYVAVRSIYPLVWGRPPWLFLSTVPGYGIVWYMLGAVVLKAFGSPK